MAQVFSDNDAIPLAAAPVISTSNVDEAASIISSRQAPVRVDRIAREDEFRFRMNGQFLKRSFVGFNSFGTDTLVRSTGAIEDAVAIIMGDSWRRSAYVEMDGERFGFSGTSAAIASPTRQGSVWRPRNSGAYVLGLSSEALVRRFQEVTGRAPEGQAVFRPGIDLSSGVGRSMQECFFALVRQIERGGNPGDHSLLVSLLEDTLINSVLALPGQFRTELERHNPLQGTDRIVRIAEEYICANATEPITLSDLVDVCQCSSSTLYETFKSVRGYTPMQFLASRRLELARTRLISESDASATAISLDCGFNNYGRFSKAYRTHYGEAPAESRARRR